MTTTRIDKSELMEYLEHFNEEIPSELVEIEITGRDVGDQIRAEWIPMSGIRYDAERDRVIIRLDDGRREHVIDRPDEFWIREENASVKTMDVKCEDGGQHLIHLKEPMRLPAPKR